MEDVKESEDNEILFEKLRESYKIMTSKHLTKINEWLKNLVKIEYTVGGDCFFLCADSGVEKTLIIFHHRIQPPKMTF
jgi:hypothetical protein